MAREKSRNPRARVSCGTLNRLHLDALSPHTGFVSGECERALTGAPEERDAGAVGARNGHQRARHCLVASTESDHRVLSVTDNVSQARCKRQH
eukprot:1983577-Pleurochrysis_carterae.AAC.5